MIALEQVDAQLARVGLKNRFFGRPEVKELCHIMAPGEVIQHAVNGQYEGGFAMIVATDRRILLIDKKPWFLTMEDIRYDMVSEVDFYGRLLDSSITLITIGKQLNFRSWHQNRLRDMVRYIQHRVMELRQGERAWQEATERQLEPSMAQPFQSHQPSASDFASDFQAKIRRHSLAHIAGKAAISDQDQRRRPIIKPLYPRPSLVTKYQHGRFYNQPAVTSEQTS